MREPKCRMLDGHEPSKPDVRQDLAGFHIRNWVGDGNIGNELRPVLFLSSDAHGRGVELKCPEKVPLLALEGWWIGRGGAFIHAGELPQKFPIIDACMVQAKQDLSLPKGV
ncbi:hypothetical protein CLCR_03182 [Cladophialophora carrionii]|uniref:Uncharacterized protein n=1 Tax=Cladophialophora carrionii TaxID=86049 RepID=A0A1C1D3F7_9EURO|nr:hypothetical protein CLCR_03182 [Cladophialophora carrionii]